MNDQPQDFTLTELPVRPSEVFARHYNEYNRRWYEALNQGGKCAMPDMPGGKLLAQSEGCLQE